MPDQPETTTDYEERTITVTYRVRPDQSTMTGITIDRNPNLPLSRTLALGMLTDAQRLISDQWEDLSTPK